jgi:D-alanyl-D-alanine carboxypeptidase
MTAIVALEQHSPREKITVGRGVLQIEPTIAGLKPGVEYSLEDLLAAILIKSANDAAFAIAEYAGGSEKRFASMMNRKAAEIGMYDTFFATASGLPTGRVDSQYTTAYDLALLMRYALRFDIITSLMSRKEKTIRGGDGKDIHLRTHNRALYRYDDAPWGKTGYTREAKRTFSGTDPEEPHSITFGLLQSDSLWTDVIELKRKGMALFRALNTSYTELLIDWVRMERQEAKKVFYGRG